MRAVFSKIFHPATIAVVGATVKSEKIGHILLKNLSSFEGEVFPVNPKYSEVLHRKCFARLRDLPSVPDLVVICTPPDTLNGLLDECGRLAIGGVVVITDGFYKPEELEELRQRAAKNRVRLIGPASLGIQNPAEKLNASYAPNLPSPGRLALISESGGLGSAILDWAADKRVGFSYFVSVGKMADLDFGHLIDYFGSDSRTACILIYMEHLPNARRFMSAARAFARSKPIVLLKPPRLQADPMEGQDAVYDAAFRRAGIIRVQTVQQLFDCAQALAYQPLPAGPRLAVVTDDPSPANLAVDQLMQRGGLPALFSETTGKKLESLGLKAFNPVHLPIDTPMEDFQKAVHTVLYDEGVDGLLVIFTPQNLKSPMEAAQIPAQERNQFKPIYTSWMGAETVRAGRLALEAAHIPWYPFPERAAVVFMHMVNYRQNLELLYETPPDQPIAFSDIRREEAAGILQKVRQAQRLNLTEEEARALFACYGIQVDNRAQSESTTIYQLCIQAECDPVFGPAIAFGPGGPGAEIWEDKAYGLPPLNLALARRLVERTRIVRMLNRSQLPNEDHDLETVLCRFAYLLMDFPELDKLTLDPFVLEGGARALRAVVSLHNRPLNIHKPYGHLSISPYPTQWVREARLAGGETVLLRPIRPEDEPLEAAFARKASRESLYFRFFGYVPGLDHKMLSRFTHIDYDREMAIVAVIEEQKTVQIIGVVRIVGDGWHESAEYAIMVADAWHGKGLGSLLTNYIIEIARAQGYKRIYASFLKTNSAMRRLFERKGFVITSGRDGADEAEMEL